MPSAHLDCRSTAGRQTVAERLTFDDDGTIDELVMTGATVHLEHLGGGTYMLICENEAEHIHLTVPVKRTRAGVSKMFVYERFDKAAPGREADQ